MLKDIETIVELLKDEILDRDRIVRLLNSRLNT